ncbi:uncharacterized protein LOC113334132 isoform X2 [Papaver somniferum]|uniref:uncharacterized protein LOC113334132 isoform X2 n=1 Tax=Papaver somniferum TaxID=3469 RepID=UPI000E7032D1|nr:uncharacterized protein LOC113334132 isoform X2 [Papaver somniferum]
MAYYNKKLIHEHIKFDSDSLFCDSVLLVLAKPSKMLLLDTVCFKWILFVSSYLCFNFTCSVFDRGRATELIERYSCFNGDYEGYFDTVTSCRFVSIGSILMDDATVNSVYELDLGVGYQSKFQFIYSIVCILAHNGDSSVGAIQEEEIKKNLRSTTDALHSLYFVQHKTFHCQHWLCVGYGTM